MKRPQILAIHHLKNQKSKINFISLIPSELTRRERDREKWKSEKINK